MTDADALRIGWTQSEAASRSRTYRGLLLVVLIVQALAGLGALIWPGHLSEWLALPAPTPDGWLRAVGVMLLATAVLYAPGYIEPRYQRVPNVVGILARLGSRSSISASAATSAGSRYMRSWSRCCSPGPIGA